MKRKKRGREGREGEGREAALLRAFTYVLVAHMGG